MDRIQHQKEMQDRKDKLDNYLKRAVEALENINNNLEDLIEVQKK